MKDWRYTGTKARALLQPLIDQGMAQCAHCHTAVLPGQAWDVDHRIEQDRAPHLIHDPANWRIAHRHCNRSAGARYGNRKRARMRPPIPGASRPW